MADAITPTTGIPNDEDPQGSLQPIYSVNKLKNGSAQSGTLDDWLATSASVVDGGVDVPLKAFKLSPTTGSLLQTISAAGTQPPDFRVSGSYLPDRAVPKETIEVKAYARVVLTYADGTSDISIVPVREAVSDGS